MMSRIRLQVFAQPRLQVFAQLQALLALLLAVLAAGCTLSSSTGDKLPSGPPIVLSPMTVPQRHAAPTVGTDSPAAVIRDNAALRDQATKYVASPRSKPAVVDRLTTLTLQATQATQRLQAGRTRRGFRATDVAAARVAADALAAYLQTQAAP